MTTLKKTLVTLLAASALAWGCGAHAQESAIRKNLGERLPELGKIDEVTKTTMPGLFEVRVGTELYYSDAEGNHVIHGGHIVEVKTKRDLTEERLNKLTAIAFDDLPLKDSFAIVRGNGKRKVALFEDPNCGYCKRFERDMQKVDNVTIHVFLYPILGPDSLTKSKGLWCARDKGKAWQDWMLRDASIPPVPSPGCDTTALERNRELGRKHMITGTPTLIFTDGRRVPGAIAAADVEKMLAEAK